METVLRELSIQLSLAGFETNSSDNAIEVAGCTFWAHMTRRKMRFLGSDFKLTNFDQRRAVQLLLEALPERLKRKATKDRVQEYEAQAEAVKPFLRRNAGCYGDVNGMFLSIRCDDKLTVLAMMDYLEEGGFLCTK